MKSNHRLILFLQFLLIFAPIPFGSVGRFFNPLFFLLLAVWTMFAWRQREKPVWPPQILHGHALSVLILLNLGFILIQILPLPLFLLRLISPATVRYLPSLYGYLPAFHPISLVPLESLDYFVKFILAVFFVLSFLALRLRKQDVLRIFYTIVAVAVVQALFAFLKLARGNEYFYLFAYPISASKTFLMGTIFNIDHFCFFLGLAFPVAVSIFLAQLRFYSPGHSIFENLLQVLNEKLVLFWNLIFLIFLGVAILFTGSRAGIIAFFISGLIMAQFSLYLRLPVNSRRKVRFLFVIITIVALFIGLEQTLAKFADDSTINNTRVQFWGDSLTMFADFPLAGSGLGTFKFSYFLYDRQNSGWLTHAHNEYIEILAEGGVLGVILFGSLLFLLLFSLLRMWSLRQHPQIKALGFGVIISLLYASFHSFFDFSLRIPANLFVFLVLIALGFKTVLYHREGFKDEENLG